MGAGGGERGGGVTQGVFGYAAVVVVVVEGLVSGHLSQLVILADESSWWSCYPHWQQSPGLGDFAVLEHL